MNIDKRMLILLIIIAILSVGVIWGLINLQDSGKTSANNTTFLNDTTVANATLVEEESSSTDSSSGQYGYCAICGKALTYSESQSEITEGKVCHSCASNPYYQSGEGAEYANQKLYEAYPDEYAWMYEDSDDYDNGDNYYGDE